MDGFHGLSFPLENRSESLQSIVVFVLGMDVFLEFQLVVNAISSEVILV
jgi:hypothetical protein